MTTPPIRLPRVAIVGRPNVGKSTLANRLSGSRVSIVEPTSGVTRDRVAVPARLRGPWGERWVEVIDTGGIGVVDRDDLGPLVEEQVGNALASAQAVLFLVDVRDGLTPLDRRVADLLRGSPIPVLLVVNKTEGERLAWDVDAFRALGMPADPVGISAQNGDGVAELRERLLELLPHAPEARPGAGASPSLSIAVVGRRNAGKSTLINALAHEPRMIVSEVPGTTRDAVDVVLERDGETLVVIDTAGVRKRGRIDDAVDFFSQARSKKTIRRADVVVLLFDVTRRISGIEKALAKYAVDRHKPVVLAANKWDLATGRSPEEFRRYLDSNLPWLPFAPICFLSARDGWNVEETLALCRDLGRQAQRRVSTGELNRVLERALEARGPTRSGHRVRVRYATQAEAAPPTFVLFVNDKRLVGRAYLRYLENRLREGLGFPEVPVRVVLRDQRAVPQGDLPR